MSAALIVTVWRRRGQEENLSMRRLMLMVLLSVYVGFRSAGVDNAAHIGGLVGGVILALPVTYFKKRGNTVLPEQQIWLRTLLLTQRLFRQVNIIVCLPVCFCILVWNIC